MPNIGIPVLERFDQRRNRGLGLGVDIAEREGGRAAKIGIVVFERLEKRGNGVLGRATADWRKRTRNPERLRRVHPHRGTLVVQISNIARNRLVDAALCSPTLSFTIDSAHVHSVEIAKK